MISGVLFLSAIIFYMERKFLVDTMREPVAADSISANTAVVGFFDTTRVVVANIDGKIIAVTAICTHQACTVGYNALEHTLDCPCHGSRYTLQGKNIQGPAEKPLAPIAVEVKDNKIWLAE